MLARALDVLFILHADHEQNCGTTAMRGRRLSHADPVLAHAPRRPPRSTARCHGGANEARRPHAHRDRLASTTCPAFIERREGGQGPAAGLRPPRLQELRPAGHDHQEDRRTTCSRSPARTRCSTSRSKLEEVALQRRLLHQPQALPERRLLLGPDLPGDGLPDRDVHRAVRHPPHVGLAGALDGAARRQGPEDRPAPPVRTSARRLRDYVAVDER